jgi:hypothetical protein
MTNANEYVMKIDPILDKELAELAIELGVTKEELFRRALDLFEHSVKADSIKLVTKGIEQNVLIK